MGSKSRYLGGRAILSEPISKDARIVELVDSYFRHIMPGD
jgi:hypothetical protein